MQSGTIIWRRLDRPGHEIARLSETAAGPILAGTAIFQQDDQPCRLDYSLVCDTAWRTRSAKIGGWIGDTKVAIDIAADDARWWTRNGVACPGVQGCDDIDLSFSPATNLLPLRRLNPSIGQSVSVKAAWLRFPGFTLEPLEQIYQRVGPLTYRYESGGGVFAAVLEVNEIGFVTRYPDLWEEEKG